VIDALGYSRRVMKSVIIIPANAEAMPALTEPVQ